jgi:hypothetical protein
MFRWFRRRKKKREVTHVAHVSREVKPTQNYVLYNKETKQYYVKTVDGEAISTSNVNLAKVYTSYAYLKRLQKTLPEYEITWIK